jgi:hypothetical protein
MHNRRLVWLAALVWGAILLLGVGLVFFIGIPAQGGTEAAPLVPSDVPTIQPSPSRQPEPTLILPTPFLPTATVYVPPTEIPPTPLPTQPPAPLFSATPASPINPLTGLEPVPPSLLERRPVAVKIALYPRSSQSYLAGVSLADVVYEYYLEDGLSRFTAFFYGNDTPRAGPVRSARYLDEHLMRMYHSVLVFGNADDRVEDFFNEAGLQRFLVVPRTDNCPPLCRDTRIGGYNNLFVDTRGINGYMRYINSENLRPPLRSSVFTPTLQLPWLGQPLEKLTLRFSSESYHYWQYDPDLGRYLRFQERNPSRTREGETYKPLIDSVTREQVATDNLAILWVTHNQQDVSAEMYKVSLEGKGPALFLRDGYVFRGEWRRDQFDQPLRVTDAGGNPFALKPGNTFFILVGERSVLSQDENDWRIQFTTP